MGRRLFADESKQRDYLLVVAEVPGHVVPRAAREVRSLLRPGQARLHMKHESDPTRRRPLSVIRSVPGLRATVLVAGPDCRDESERRRRCLDALVDLAAEGTQECTVVLDRDPSREKDDRQTIYRRLRVCGAEERVRYEHSTATVHPLLAVPDALAWAYARGGDWRRRCGPLTTTVVGGRTARDPSAASVRTGLGSTSRR